MAMLTDTVTDALQSVLISPWQRWLAEHPLVAWLVMHPLWALALVGLGLLLFAGLWSAIARLTEGFWLTLVRLPFRLGGWLFVAIARLLLHRRNKAAKPAESPNRLSDIMARLDQLQTEQAALLAEMHQLVNDEPTWTAKVKSLLNQPWPPTAKPTRQETNASEVTVLAEIFPAQSE